VHTTKSFSRYLVFVGLLRGVGGGGGGELLIEKFNHFLTKKCKCYINIELSYNNCVGPWLWKEAKNKEGKVKSEFRGRHSNYY
jgi:hypothetical protein